MKKLIFSRTKLSYPLFFDFINRISDDFNPPFLSYVDVNDYYLKVNAFAEFFVCMDNDKVVGLVIAYCNDMVNKMSYVPFVGTDSNYRNNHVATKLLLLMITEIKNKGMERVRIRTNNKFALDCYQKLGFNLYEKQFEPEYNLTRFYLERKL